MERFFLIVIIALQIACTLLQPRQEVIDNKYKTSENTMLNYEDAARKYTIDSIDDHFNIHIEIENPHYKVKLDNFKLNNLYKTANIEGIAIYSINLDKNGKIKNFKRIKRAGLGLDKITDQVINNMKIFPVYKKGENYNASVVLTISIVRKNIL